MLQLMYSRRLVKCRNFIGSDRSRKLDEGSVLSDRWVKQRGTAPHRVHIKRSPGPTSIIEAQQAAAVIHNHMGHGASPASHELCAKEVLLRTRGTSYLGLVQLY